MPRLRTLRIATPEGPRDILILDEMTTTDLEQAHLNTLPSTLPHIIAFPYSVDLPQAETEGAFTVLVLGAHSRDVSDMADSLAAAGIGQDVITATPTSDFLPGLPRPRFVVRTAAYEALAPEKKRGLEEHIRYLVAK